MLSVATELNVVMQNVIMLGGVAPILKYNIILKNLPGSILHQILFHNIDTRDLHYNTFHGRN